MGGSSSYKRIVHQRALMTFPRKPKLSPKEMWDAEEALSEEERRARYKVDKIISAGDLPSWSSLVHQHSFPSQETPKEIDEKLNSKVSLWRGNIVSLEIDAYQNAANKSLMGGGGIDGAIHSAAGRKLVQETMQLGGCETGQTKISRGYNLPAKFVLHTVGPIGEKKDLLQSCYRSTLDLALRHKIRSLALCGVSTGIYGYPLEKACRVALRTVRSWLATDDHADHIDLIVFVVWLEREWNVYKRHMAYYFPVIPHQPDSPSSTIPEDPEPPQKDVQRVLLPEEREQLNSPNLPPTQADLPPLDVE